MAESVQIVHGSNKKRWPFWVIALVVLVLALGAGVGLYVWQANNGVQMSQGDSELPAELEGLHNLRTGDDEAAFQARVDELLAQPNLSNEALYGVRVQEGMHASEKGDYAGAVEYFKKAEQVNPTYDIAQLIASAYQRAGDNAQALSYYRVARDRVPANDSGYEMELETLNMTISQLEASE